MPSAPTPCGLPTSWALHLVAHLPLPSQFLLQFFRVILDDDRGQSYYSPPRPRGFEYFLFSLVMVHCSASLTMHRWNGGQYFCSIQRQRRSRLLEVMTWRTVNGKPIQLKNLIMFDAEIFWASMTGASLHWLRSTLVSGFIHLSSTIGDQKRTAAPRMGNK